MKHGAKRLQIDGSLFDLKKDSVKVIATTIAGNVSLHRLTALQQALGDEIKAIKAAHANSECGGSYMVASARATYDAK